MEDLLTSKLNRDSEELKQNREALEKVEIELINLLKDLNLKRSFVPDYATILNKIREMEPNLPRANEIESLLKENEGLFTTNIRCRVCNIIKLKKDFLLQSNCYCMCITCTQVRVWNYSQCLCSRIITPVMLIELGGTNIECEGCHMEVPAAKLMLPRNCQVHAFCEDCAGVVSSKSYCYMCPHD